MIHSIQLASILILLWHSHAVDDVKLNFDKITGDSSSSLLEDGAKTMSHLANLRREEPTYEINVLQLDYLNHPFEKSNTLRRLGGEKQYASSLSNFTDSPSVAPSYIQTSAPSYEPTTVPSYILASAPSYEPTNVPSYIPTYQPSNASDAPSLAPTKFTKEPLRIVFETSELEKMMQISSFTEEKVKVVIQRILPQMSEIWSSILSIVPVEGNITVKPDECFGFYDVPPNLVKEGVSNADILVFVSGHNAIQGVSLCSKTVLASASHCSLDQYDRPVVGFINFCLDNIKIQTENAAIAVGVHELAHLFGFSDSLFHFFRDGRNGNPLTPRPLKKSIVECVDGSIKQAFIASSTTLQKRQGILSPNYNGSPYYEIVTPTVAEIVRNHFGCQEALGARLENKPTTNSCTGSHLDERFFFTDAMSPIFSSNAVSILSPLTVALLKDTGWYDVNFASEYIKNNPFGLGAGCEFLDEDSCIAENKVPEKFQPYFCDSITRFNDDGKITKETGTTCDPSFNHIAYCDLVDFSSTLPSGIESSQTGGKHFSDPNLGSIFIQGDDCPIPSIFSVDCTDSSTNPLVKTYPEEQHGSESRCFNTVSEHPNGGGITRAVCLRSKCNQSDRTLDVYLGENVITCENEGDVHHFVSTTLASFVCPKLSSICPQMFCPSMCSGQGICNHGLDQPRCECYDESDTSPGCYGIGIQYDVDIDETQSVKVPNEPVTTREDPTNDGIKRILNIHPNLYCGLVALAVLIFV